MPSPAQILIVEDKDSPRTGYTATLALSGGPAAVPLGAYASPVQPPTNFRPCGVNAGVMSAMPTDYWPLALYDTREGLQRDSVGTGQPGQER